MGQIKRSQSRNKIKKNGSWTRLTRLERRFSIYRTRLSTGIENRHLHNALP